MQLTGKSNDIHHFRQKIWESNTLGKKCPYSELFWSAFSRIRILNMERYLPISLYSVRMWENVDQNNSEYGHFSRNDTSDISNSFIQECLIKINIRPKSWHYKSSHADHLTAEFSNTPCRKHWTSKSDNSKL